MKAPNGPLILAVFCVAVFAVSWIAITALTTPTRAVTSGVALVFVSGLFLWFAQTNRMAIARGLIALGSTALAAPMAAVQAVTNDMIFSLGMPQADTFIALDTAITVGWHNVGIGAVIALVLIVAGGVMHRPKRP